MWEKGKKKTERGERGEETTECWCCVVGGVVQSCCHGECVGVRAECLFFLVVWGMPLSFAKVCTCERGWKRF